MRRLDPIGWAIFRALGAVTVAALLMTGGARLDDFDPGLMYAIAQVGIAIVFAFVVEAVWIVERVNRNDPDHPDFLGTMCGFAIAGLTGVAISLAVGAHRAAGHSNLLDAFGFWWSVASLMILGGLVVVQPLLTDQYRARGERSEAASPELSNREGRSLAPQHPHP